MRSGSAKNVDEVQDELAMTIPVLSPLERQKKQKIEAIEYAKKVQDYKEHVRQLYKPKASQAKKDELRMANRDTSPFSRASPHLPLAGMLTNDAKVPVSMNYIKLRKAENEKNFDRFNGIDLEEDDDDKGGLGLEVAQAPIR